MTDEGTCETCGSVAFQVGTCPHLLCDTCELAYQADVSIEEARLEVEHTAAWWTIRFGRAEGRSCTCGVVDHVHGRGAILHFDVRHALGCPLSPPEFNWPAIDEDARERIFGYRGREHHMRRLIEALHAYHHDREVLEC